MFLLNRSDREHTDHVLLSDPCVISVLLVLYFIEGIFQGGLKIYNEIGVSEALKREDLFFLDVRSPREHSEGRIPGSVNIPLFTDEEQKTLGITYKQEGSLVARRLGLEFASPRLTMLVDRIAELSGDRMPVLYCWRGGLRSLSLCQILYLAGVPAMRLKGGYKAYRRFINNSLSNYRLSPRPIVLHGLTGTGKTLLIQRLISEGYSAVDLEGMACHRGSAFGKIGFENERLQKDFEGMLWSSIEKHRESPYLVIEKEGKKIGRISLPAFLVRSMEEGIHVLLEAPLEVRAQRIVAEYVRGEIGTDQKKQFISAFNSLTPRLGKKTVKTLLSLFEAGDYYKAAFILCRDYYDRFYQDARPDRYTFSEKIDTSSIDSAAGNIKIFIEQYINKTRCDNTKRELISK